MQTPWRLTLTLAFGLTFAAPTALQAQTTIVVSPSCGTGTCIQDAINAASSGDTIEVSPGQYNELITLPSAPAKDLDIVSSGGPAATIIDGLGLGRVVTFPPGSSSATLLSGFTIRGGSITGASGAGILCDGVSPTIRGNWILCNQTDVGGGGIACVNGSAARIEDNLILDNYAEGINLSGGGGIFCDNGSDAQIYDNRILYNGANSIDASALGASGGGIAVKNSGPSIWNNEIRGNFTAIGANGAGAGVGVYGPSTTTNVARIYGNRIYDNEGWYGAGAYAGGGSAPTFQNNVFSGNIADGGSTGVGIGGGMYVEDATPVLLHNTFTGNIAADLGGGIAASGNSTVVTLLNSIVWGNTDGAFPTPAVSDIDAAQFQVFIADCNIGFTSLIGSNIISEDPLFVDPNGPDSPLQPAGSIGSNYASAFVTRDFHIQARNSLGLMNPSIDAASPQGGFAADMEGDLYGTLCAAEPDMGADEFDVHAYMVGGVEGGSPFPSAVPKSYRFVVEEDANSVLRIVGPPTELAFIAVGFSVLGTPVTKFCDSKWWLDAAAPGFAVILNGFPIPNSGILEIPFNFPSGQGFAGTFVSTQTMVAASGLQKATNRADIFIVAPGGNDLPLCP